MVGAQTAEIAAAGQLEEVVVTAEKRDTSLQETPTSVVAISGEELTKMPVSDLRQALQGIPSVSVSSSGNFGQSTVIRGIGPLVAGGQPGVSTLSDGVYNSSSLNGKGGYFDIARVEVLLGPQGTLYGKNAEGGVVNVITNDPTQSLEARVTAGYGNYSAQNVQGTLNVPLSDSLAVRVATNLNKHDGYLSSGQEDANAQSVRAKLLFKPSDAFSTMIGLERTEVDQEGSAMVPAFTHVSGDPFETPFYSSEQHFKQRAWRAWANINADVGIGTLTVLPAYGKQYSADQLTVDPQIGFTSIGTGTRFTLERSAEVRLASHADSRIQWMLGYSKYKSGNGGPRDPLSGNASVQNGLVVVTPFPNGRVATLSDNQTTSEGIFGQVTVPVTDSLRLIAGVRNSKDTSHTISDNGFPAAPNVNLQDKWTNTSYRAGVQYDLGKESMLYATYSTAYRPGGFSPVYSEFGPEDLKSYEIGSKNEFFDHRMRLNVAAYYYDYSGYQQIVITLCDIPGLPACVTPGIPVNLTTPNVDKVTVKGLEVSSVVVLSRADTLDLSVAYSDSKIASPLLVSPVENPFVVEDIQGQHLPFAAPLSGAATYAHTFQVRQGTWTPQLTASYQAKTGLVALPYSALTTQAAHWMVDAQLAYAPTGGKWRALIWGRNLTDEVVKASYQAGGATGGVSLQPPRTFGVSLGVTL